MSDLSNAPDISKAGLDDKAVEFNKLTGLEEDIIPDPIVEPSDPPGDTDDPPAEQDPPGYMNYEEWVAAGKNPDDFKGKNAYVAEHDRIQKERDRESNLQSELRETRELLQDVVESAEEVRQRDRAEQEAKHQAELEQARKDMDVDAALAAQQKLDALKEKPVAPKINPIIPQFFSENPLLDKESGQFNAEFYEDFESVYNSKLDQLTSFGTRGVSDTQVQKALKAALSEAKGLNPELFKSQRNTRQTQGRTTGSQTQTTGSLADYKIDDKDDPRNQGAANDIYEMLKKKNPEKAEQFKKKLLAGGQNG